MTWQAISHREIETLSMAWMSGDCMKCYGSTQRPLDFRDAVLSSTTSTMNLLCVQLTQNEPDCDKLFQLDYPNFTENFPQPAVMIQKRYNPETFHQTMASTKQDLSSSDAFEFIFELFLL